MCERSHFQPCKCPKLFGMEFQELWCPSCAAEFDAWVDEQAAAAEAVDRTSGLGWVWEGLIRPSPN
jgi:hypothetical protein